VGLQKTTFSRILEPMTTHPITHNAMMSRSAAHAEAARHSARVKRLRRLMPGLAAAMGAAFLLSIFLDPRTALTSVGDVSELGISGAAITMQNPRMTGFNKDSRSYEVTAERADQSIKDSSQIGLTQLSARIQTGDGFAQLHAPLGRFNTQSQQLELTENLTIDSDKGDSARLSDAQVDLKEGRITTRYPVEIAIGNTRLSADSMDISQNGDHVVFDGRVRMVMQPRQGEPVSAPPSDMSAPLTETPAAPEGALP
jgi:lipopolysaccharide export system protein LptC